ncbi:MAG: hypothetical protein WCV50_02990 [Patescibacteria group bacterium]|jgi:hypothetical protein
MRVEKPPEIKKPEKFIPDQPLNKIIFLAILVVAATLLFWLAWHNVLTTGVKFNRSFENILVIISTLLAFCLMFSLLAIAEITVVKRLLTWLMVVVSGLVIFIFFPVSLWTMISFLLVVLAFLFWKREIRVDMESRSKFLPQRVVSAGLKGAVTLLLLASCFAYYGYMVTGTDASKRLDQALVDDGAKAINNILVLYFKDKYSPKMTLDEFIRQNSLAAVEQAELKTGQAELDKAINEGLAGAEQEAVDTFRESLLDTFQIQASGSDTMDEVEKKIVSKNVDKYIGSFKKFIPALLAISLFFVLNIFSFVYRELIKSFTFLAFHILVWLHFIKVKKVQVEAEKITL